MPVPEARHTHRTTQAHASAVWAAEAMLLWRYVVRTRAIIFWLLAAVVWPIAYLTLLNGGGATPLAIILALAALPLGPILWALFGARLSMVKGWELGAAWPAPRSARSLGVSLVLVGWALIGTLTTMAAALWGVEPGFWHPISFVTLSLLQGLGMLLPSIILWTAVGFAIGHRTRGIFRSILPPLAPIAMMFGYTLGQKVVQSGGGAVWGLVSTSAAAWFSSVDAFGIGPWADVFHLGVLVMVVAAIFVLALSALSAYGRQFAAGLLAVACIVAEVGLMQSVGQNAAVIQPASIPAARAYGSGAKSPVRVSDAHISLSLLHPPFLSATAALDFTAQQRLQELRFFMTSSLGIQWVEFDGRRVRFSRTADGWVTVRMPSALTAGLHGELRVAYAGAPYIMAFGADGGGVTEFVSAEGWSLPPGTWYPLLGKSQDSTRFALDLQAPAGYLSVTPYGVIRGSTGVRPLTGTGRSMEIVGGHVAEVADLGGVPVYAAADQIGAARSISTEALPFSSPSALASCISGILRPRPSLRLVWTSVFAGGLWPGAKPWQSGEEFEFGPGVRGGLGMQDLGGNISGAYYNNFAFTYPQAVYSLWLSGGQSAALPSPNQPQGTAALEVGGAIFTACGSPYTNGFMGPDQISKEISRLPKQALQALAAESRAAYVAGKLTVARVQQLAQAAQR